MQAVGHGHTIADYENYRESCQFSILCQVTVFILFNLLHKHFVSKDPFEKVVLSKKKGMGETLTEVKQNICLILKGTKEKMRS